MHLTNKCNLPNPFVDIVNAEYTYKPKRYGVTSVLNREALRETILKRRHNDEVVEDVANMIWLIFGNAVHLLLENSKATDTQDKELRLEHTMQNGYTLSGIADLYDSETGEVIDYKTAGIYKALKGDYKDYIRQICTYLVLLRANGKKAVKGTIVALLKDWSKSELKRANTTGEKYPQIPVDIVSVSFTEQELDEWEAVLNQTFDELERLEKLDDDDLPICEKSYRCFGKKATFAVMKNGNSKATRAGLTKEEAESYILEALEKNPKLSGELFIEERYPDESKCMLYCGASPFCSHFRSNYATHFLTENGMIKSAYSSLAEAQEANELILKGKGEVLER